MMADNSMEDEEQAERIRNFMLRLGRNFTDHHVEEVAQVRIALRDVDFGISEEVGFALMVQAWKEANLNDAEAREMALIQIALLVCDGDLEIINNTVVISQTGKRWLDQLAKTGLGQNN